MSAWLCSDGMISDLAYHINLKCAPDGSGALPRGVDALARLMRDMNEDALVARYGDEKTIFAPFVYNPVHTVMGDVMLLKGLRCFLYQCSEGDVPEKDAFSEIESIADEIAYAIVRRLPEYDNATWGW